MRKLLLYLVYTLFILKFLSIERFAIFFIIFYLHFKYSNVALHYIYNNFNIKNCITILICKQKLKKFLIKITLKEEFIYNLNYI